VSYMDSEPRINKESVLKPMISNRSHPVFVGKYLVGTNQIEQMGDKVKNWLENRTPGGIIYGRPRLGKTSAIKYLKLELTATYGAGLPVFMNICHKHKTPNEGTFFEELLKSVGHGFVFNGHANIKRERLIKFLIERTDASKGNRLVLFMDEAQFMYEIEYQWLIDINNELDRYNIFTTVILVGQEELTHQRSAFLAAKKDQIIGRFMVHVYNFEGVKNANDIRTCLIGYDDQAKYPAGTDWTFTRFFFPDLFEEGFRLQNHAEELLDIFKEIRREHGINSALEIPMQYLIRTIEYCLENFGIEGEDLKVISRANWKEAIRRSGYIDAEIYKNML